MTITAYAPTPSVLTAAVVLDRTAESVGTARRFIRATLTGWGYDPDIAVLLVSELATNALEHVTGDGTMTVTAAVWRNELRLTVSDPGCDCTAVKPRRAFSQDEDGRGLAIILSLTSDFRCEALEFGGKVCQATLDVTPVVNP